MGLKESKLNETLIDELSSEYSYTL